MILGLLAILGCQLLGEVLVRVFDLPLPGPVLGLVFFLILLRVRRAGAESRLERAGKPLLDHLQLLFVPAGVGIVVLLAQVGDQALPITLGLVGSWVAGLVVTGLVVAGLNRWMGRR